MVIDFFYDDAGPLHAPSEITLNGQPRMVIYDANGNTTSLADMSDPTAVAERTITYNDDNMPVSVTHATKGTTLFLYDGEGQRAKKSGGAGITYYVNDLFEVREGVETSFVFANGLRIAQVTATEKRFLHADHLGSTVAVTNEAGMKLEGKAYVPNGLTRGTEDIGGIAYQFTDQERDTSTGLYNYDARLYDPVIGRFLSADTIIPDFLIHKNLNRYSYVLNNPLKFIDPSGHEGRLIIHSVGGSGPSLSLGIHSWLEYQPEGITIERRTYGTYGNSNGRQHVKGLNINTLGELFGPQGAQRDTWLDDMQEARLAEILDEKISAKEKAWGYFSPCSDFASDTWEELTGEKLEDRSFLFLSTPHILADSIEKANNEEIDEILSGFDDEDSDGEGATNHQEYGDYADF